MEIYRQYIDGLVIELQPDGITVATHYSTPGEIVSQGLERALIAAAIYLQAQYGTPIAVVISGGDDEPRTAE